MGVKSESTKAEGQSTKKKAKIISLREELKDSKEPLIGKCLGHKFYLKL
jgi:hypothetical protein